MTASASGTAGVLCNTLDFVCPHQCEGGEQGEQAYCSGACSGVCRIRALQYCVMWPRTVHYRIVLVFIRVRSAFAIHKEL